MILLISTKTQEEYNTVTSFYKNGLSSNYWPKYKSETYIRVIGDTCISFGDLPFARREGESVTSFEEWAKANNQLRDKANMKYVVEVNNQDELNTVRTHAGSSKYMQNDVKYPWTVNGVNGLMSSPDYYKARTKEHGAVITFKQFADMFSITIKPSKTLKLTSDYNAEVDYDKQVVQVGCQTIPFKTVEALAKLIEE